MCRPFTSSVSFGVRPVRLNLLPCKMILHMILRPYGMKFFRGSDFQGRQMSCTGCTAQTVDKVGAGSYPQHHFSVNSLCFNKNLKKLQNSLILDSLISKILANFFKFIHANVSPAFISIRTFPMY